MTRYLSLGVEERATTAPQTTASQITARSITARSVIDRPTTASDINLFLLPAPCLSHSWVERGAFKCQILAINSSKSRCQARHTSIRATMLRYLSLHATTSNKHQGLRLELLTRRKFDSTSETSLHDSVNLSSKSKLNVRKPWSCPTREKREKRPYSLLTSKTKRSNTMQNVGMSQSLDCRRNIYCSGSEASPHEAVARSQARPANRNHPAYGIQWYSQDPICICQLKPKIYLQYLSARSLFWDIFSRCNFSQIVSTCGPTSMASSRMSECDLLQGNIVSVSWWTV